MKELFKNISKGVKKVMSVSRDVIVDTISNDNLKIRTGAIVVFIGLGLMISGYLGKTL